MVSGGVVEASMVLVELSELESVVGAEAVVVCAGGEVTAELVLEELAVSVGTEVTSEPVLVELISVLLEVEALVEALVDD